MSDEVKFFLYGVARRHLKIADPYFAKYSSVICETLAHPACRQIELTREKRERLVNLLLELHESPDAEAEAFRVSLERLNREKEFNPFLLDHAQWLIRNDPDAHLKLRDALATVAIAWQLHVYGNRLVLTCEEYNQTVKMILAPPN